MGEYTFDMDWRRLYHGSVNPKRRRDTVVAEERLFTLTEMAESLGLAEPTARRYRDAFEEFLPSVGVGRRRKFT
jgi:hypothetical protein